MAESVTLLAGLLFSRSWYMGDVAVTLMKASNLAQGADGRRAMRTMAASITELLR